MKKIKLMADYQCHPIWDLNPESYSDIDPKSLSISEELKSRLALWAKKYDETLDSENPAKSGFKTKKQENEFNDEGKYLAGRLQKELGEEYEIAIQEIK